MMRAAFGASFLAKAPKKDLKSQTNHLQPVFVRPGEDSFESIGSANGQQPSEQAWAAVLRDFFPLPADDSEDPVRVGDRVLVRMRHESDHDWKPGEVVEDGRRPKVKVDGQDQASDKWDLVVKDEQNTKFAESLIDSMMEQKKEELATYRREKERSQRLASSGVARGQHAVCWTCDWRECTRKSERLLSLLKRREERPRV